MLLLVLHLQLLNARTLLHAILNFLGAFFRTGIHNVAQKQRELTSTASSCIAGALMAALTLLSKPHQQAKSTLQVVK